MREEGIQRLSNIKLKSGQQDFLVMYYLIKDLKAAVGQYASGKILDVGCGNKPYEHFFQHIDQYVGCDVVQSSLSKVDVICKATQLEFDDASFDTVFTTQVIEHVEDPGRMLSEIYRILKPGGYLILSAPLTWEIHEAPYDYFRYTKYGLDHMIRNGGFEMIYTKSNGGKWAAIFQMNLNIIYSTFKKRSLAIKLFKFAFIHAGLTSLINHFAKWLDSKYYDDILTLNYVLVAKKN
jgi:SAM-dependent methyltransferase